MPTKLQSRVRWTSAIVVGLALSWATVATAQPQRTSALVEDLVLAQLAQKAWVGGDFTVKAEQGTVTLAGTVPSEAARARLGRIARGTMGVTEVRNELRVSAAAAPSAAGPAVDDAELARRVARQIAAAVQGAKAGEDWWLTGWRVEGPDNNWSFVVEAEQGRVYLEGDVPRLAIVRKAIDAARATEGVRSVRSDLELDRMRPARYPYAPYPAYGYHPWPYGPDYHGYDRDRAPAEGRARGTSISGRVTSLDRDSGRVTLQTGAGPVQMSLPPAALKDVQPGSRLTLQVETGDASPSASPAPGDGSRSRSQ